MKKQDTKNYSSLTGLFNLPMVKDKNNQTINKELLDKYEIKDMNDWASVNADLIITDPPFGIEFSGKNGNYHRNVKNVVSGYVEWKVHEYEIKIRQLLECIEKNLKKTARL